MGEVAVVSQKLSMKRELRVLSLPDQVGGGLLELSRTLNEKRVESSVYRRSP